MADVDFDVISLADYIADYEDLPFVVNDDDVITYAEAARKSAVLARILLLKGVTRGTRVAIAFPNDYRFIVSWLAILRIGAVAVPLSILASARETRKVIDHARIELLVAGQPDWLANLEGASPIITSTSVLVWNEDSSVGLEIRGSGEIDDADALTSIDLETSALASEDVLFAHQERVKPADAGSIFYTSGSTSEPKGVLHSHEAMMRQGAKLAATYPYHKGDRVFTQMPFFWVGGITTLLNAMFVGACILGSTRRGAELLDFLEEQEVSYVLGWPHQMKQLASDPTFARRRFLCMRGGTLFDVMNTGTPIRHRTRALGMTETFGQHTVTLADIPAHLAGSSGPPMPGMSHRIVEAGTDREVAPGEPGELLVKGDTLFIDMIGQDRSDLIDADGWFRTSDLCSMREGHIFFHERLDDLIKVSGASVSPREIEALLLSLPDVEQAYVFGIEDAEKGQIAGAVVVPVAGRECDEQSLHHHAEQGLARYKVPRVWAIIEHEDVPVTATNKLDRRALASLLANKAQSRRPQAG